MPVRLPTETEPVPNPVAGDSERVTCKSKKGEGFRKPNTEPPPNGGQGLLLRGDGLIFLVRPELVIPRIPVEVRNAAETDLPVLQSALTL